MPIYDFRCENCQNEYECLTPYDPAGKYSAIKCPSCDSVAKKRVPSICSFAFSNPVGTDRWENSHDYRYKFKAPGVAAERANAAAASHVGATPYNGIDDISSGNNFGPAK